MSQSASGTPAVRRYRPKWWLRIFALFFLGFSGTGMISLWAPMLSGSRPLNTISFVAPAVLTVVGACMTAHYFNSFVVLYSDAIELQTFFSNRKLSFAEIRGKREYETTDSDGVTTRYIRLDPVDPSKRALEFTRYFNFDSDFYDWLSQVPQVRRDAGTAIR
ncbi:hypothetical protein [Occallatibacter riparius]|uniref:Uncharacterized protein n=1 Tax=Occallatibacter riparius TaxID=1002689 RepID=A0A9J7BNZ0_9BACT|nr:hypothetical protein [Occallatibacter riparius]UWZ82869.1 hypothetical protein MOP44_20150 [Occallatibacter riparius]